MLPACLSLMLVACAPEPASEMKSMNGRGSPDAAAYGDEVLQAHAAVRAATERFHDLDSAVASGYAALVAKCFSDSAHQPSHGAMGYHHVNRAYVDSVVEIEKPEILLYERETDGRYALTGVEYILPFAYWPRASVPPTLMGRELFPEDERQYWYVHMWVWKSNPEGLFADWNPDVRCSE